MSFLESLSVDTLDNVYEGIRDDMTDLTNNVKITCQEDYDHYSKQWKEMNQISLDVFFVYARKLDDLKNRR